MSDEKVGHDPEEAAREAKAKKALDEIIQHMTKKSKKIFDQMPNDIEDDDLMARMQIASDLALIHSVVDITIKTVTGDRHGWCLMIHVNGVMVMIDSMHIKDQVITDLMQHIKIFRDQYNEDKPKES